MADPQDAPLVPFAACLAPLPLSRAAQGLSCQPRRVKVLPSGTPRQVAHGHGGVGARLCLDPACRSSAPAVCGPWRPGESSAPVLLAKHLYGETRVGRPSRWLHPPPGALSRSWNLSSFGQPGAVVALTTLTRTPTSNTGHTRHAAQPS